MISIFSIMQYTITKKNEKIQITKKQLIYSPLKSATIS